MRFFSVKFTYFEQKQAEPCQIQQVGQVSSSSPVTSYEYL